MKSDKNFRYFLYTDSEWVGTTWLSTTILLTERIRKKHFLHEDIPIERITFVNSLFSKKIGKPIDSHFGILPILLELLRKLAITNIVFINFFSPADIYWIFPHEFPTTLSKDQHGKIHNFHFTQKSIIRGFGKIDEISILFQDYSGIFGIASLQKKLEQLNLPTEDKKIASKYKTKMDKFLIKFPETFLRYAEADVNSLPIIRLEFQRTLNILAKRLKARIFELPLTIGTTVSRLISSNIKDQKTLAKNSQKGFFKLHGSNEALKPLGFVTGGRCCNENPFTCFAQAIHDIDINGCYTNIMKRLSIPIDQFETLENKDGITIEEFLNRKFYRDYWVLSFDTIFDFEQDIFPTKILTNEAIDDELDEHVKNMLYFTHEVRNGILTKELLDLVMRFWTDKQKTWFLNIKFKSIIYYEKVTNEFELKDFIESLEKIRYGKDDKLSQSAKLIINTIYGVLASPFFSIGNILIANKITAEGRSQIYLLKKKFNLLQSITDGGIARVGYNDKNIKLNFKISYKTKNKSAFYFNKADYAYGTTTKIRGNSGKNIKYHFFREMLNNQSFNLKTRLYSESSIYKFGAYNHEVSRNGYFFTKHIPVGLEKRIFRIFTINGMQRKFRNMEDYNNFTQEINKRLRKHQNLFESKHITMNIVDDIKNKNFYSNDIKKIKSKNLVTSELKIIEPIIANLLVFDLTSSTLKKIKEFKKKNKNLNIVYGTLIIKEILKKHFPRDNYFFVPKSYFHNLYYNSIEFDSKLELKTEMITFDGFTPLQKEKIIVNKIFERFYNQKNYLIRDFIFIVSNKTITDELIDFFHETIKTIELSIPYKILFYSKRTNKYYESNK